MLIRVKVTEIHIQEMEIEADGFESARKKIEDGEGTEISTSHYDYTLDCDEWFCYEAGNYDNNTAG